MLLSILLAYACIFTFLADTMMNASTKFYDSKITCAVILWGAFIAAKNCGQISYMKYKLKLSIIQVNFLQILTKSEYESS